MTLLSLPLGNPEGIIAMVKTIKENIRRGHIPPPNRENEELWRIANDKMDKILSLEPSIEKTESREKLIIGYDDLLDDLISLDVTDYM